MVQDLNEDSRNFHATKIGEKLAFFTKEVTQQHPCLKKEASSPKISKQIMVAVYILQEKGSYS